MAVLGKIRQKSIFLILIIGMALFAFVISGVFDGSGSNSGPTDPVGIINGEEIDIYPFRQMVERVERGYNFSSIQAVDYVWDQVLQSTIFKQEFEKLGIDAGKEQIEQIISSNETLTKDDRFHNESGFFDFGLFTDFIATIKETDPAAYESWRLQEQNIVSLAKQNIYFDLIKAGSGLIEVEAKAIYHLENDNINMKFVRIPYDVIDDSLITVTDSEIKKYIKDNREKYKRKATVDIQYVMFEELPTDEDEEKIRLRLEELIEQRVVYNDVSKLTDTLEGFKTVKNISDFVDEHSEQAFDSVYRPKGQLASEYAEILFGLEPGKVFGPYKDGSNYKISRFINRKKDASIRASHILIAYAGAAKAAATITRTKKEAKKLAEDILRKAKRKNADFEALARENSDGPSKTRGGDLGYFQEVIMTQEFFDFADKYPVGSIGLVKTEFGFHIVKVTGKEDIVLIADVSAEIVPSNTTSNETFRQATQFEMESSSDFIATAEQKELPVRPVRNITPMEENLPGLVGQRDLVKWAFEEDTQVGDIQRFNMNSKGGYVIVQLTKKTPQGFASVEDVRDEITQILIRNKKAVRIKEQYSDKKTLEDFTGGSSDFEIETASAINQRDATLVGVGNEPYVIGAAFALKVNHPSKLIKGNNGVYMLQVTQENKAPDLGNYSTYVAQAKEKANKTLPKKVFEALRSTALIEDNRILYY